MGRFWRVVLMFVCGWMMLGGGVFAQNHGFEIERVSVASDGAAANGHSGGSAISADGRWIAFASDASNLVSGDLNNLTDVFVHDRDTGTTTRVSIASNDTEGNGESYSPTLSANGRFVAFFSVASTLVADDTNGLGDIFIHDRRTGQTTRLSVSSNGTQANEVSFYPAISADGRFVTFVSRATNLIPGDSNGFDDIFIHDRQTSQTTLISIAWNGAAANGRSDTPAISANGRFVAFGSFAWNLAGDEAYLFYGIYLHDRQTGQTTHVSSKHASNASIDPSISANGRFISFTSYAGNLVTDDTNRCLSATDKGGCPDIFVYDRETGETTRVSVASDGTQANMESFRSSISADGRFVAFESYADNLVPNDTNSPFIPYQHNESPDIFVHDLRVGQTVRVSLAYDRAQANQPSIAPAISSDGNFVAFQTNASNLVEDDNDSSQDIFVSRVTFDRRDAAPYLGFVITTHTPTLTWNRLTGALTYAIQIAETPNFQDSLVYEGETSGPELEHLVTQALENGLYYWRVRGVGTEGEGDWSAPSEFVVQAD